MPTSHELTTALRSLDPADPGAGPHTDRARADLARILDTPPGESAADRPAPRRRRALAAAAVGVVASGVVLAPSLTGGDAAFATWTPTPRDVTGAQSREAVAGCRDAQVDGPGSAYAAELATAPRQVVEIRGVWTAVYLTDGAGFSALCITDGSAHVFGDWIGSIGSSGDLVAVGPRELVATDLGTGTLRAGDLSLAAGFAGADVVGVSYTSRAHGRVTATVRDGEFVLWLPGDELKDAPGDGVEVEVTHRDGTTATTLLDLGRSSTDR